MKPTLTGDFSHDVVCGLREDEIEEDIIWKVTVFTGNK